MSGFDYAKTRLLPTFDMNENAQKRIGAKNWEFRPIDNKEGEYIYLLNFFPRVGNLIWQDTTRT